MATGRAWGNPMVKERIESVSQALQFENKQYSTLQINALQCNAKLDQKLCSNFATNKHEDQPQLKIIDLDPLGHPKPVACILCDEYPKKGLFTHAWYLLGMILGTKRYDSRYVSRNLKSIFSKMMQRFSVC